MGTDTMHGMADRDRHDPAASVLDDAARADTLLREAIAILDGHEFDRAAAYVDMARQALIEAINFRTSGR
jgi:hypothetical protein